METHRFTLILVLVLFITFIIVFTDILYGVAYNLIPSIIFITVFIAYYVFWSRNRFYGEELRLATIYTSLLFIPTWFLTGLFFELGLNTSILNIFSYTLNIVFTISYVLGCEVFRRILVDNIGVKDNNVKALIVSTITTILYMKLLGLTEINLSTLSLYIIFMGYNYVTTMISILNGFKNQVSYILPIYTMINLSPLQPILNILMKRVVLGLILIVQSFILVITLYRERKIRVRRRYFTERMKRFKELFEYTLLILSIIILVLYIIGYRPLVIISGSMNPTINVGDVVVIDINDRRPGESDIIAFTALNNVIVHRVVYSYERNNKLFYITKGDANKEIDPWVVEGKQVLGKVVLTIPYLGNPTILIRKYIGDPMKVTSIAISLLLFSIIYSMFKKTVYIL